MDRETKAELIAISAKWEAVCNILEGKEVADFLLSFPEVRQVADLYIDSRPAVEDQRRCLCPGGVGICGFGNNYTKICNHSNR